MATTARLEQRLTRIEGGQGAWRPPNLPVAEWSDWDLCMLIGRDLGIPAEAVARMGCAELQAIADGAP